MQTYRLIRFLIRNSCFLMCSFNIKFLVFTGDSSIFSKLIIMLNVHIFIYRQRGRIKGIYFHNRTNYVCDFIQKVN